MANYVATSDVIITTFAKKVDCYFKEFCWGIQAQRDIHAVSSSFDTSVSFKSKLLLYFCCGDAKMEETVDGGQENLLLGLENLPGDPPSLPLETRGVKPDAESGTFICLFISGPHFVSDGSGFNGPCSIIGFCFTILSRALSAALKAFSLLSFISFQGLIPTRKPCLLAKRDVSGSPSILMDRFLLLCK
ncbi:hypothetical protein F8388_007379 [Cannabis sativa]|uniref:Uncharacterized protein n=1 Tax=Cannabis sativa TaxID=3483 RepID=A0A7J6FHZ2_CANSA|nr:hypothetical protein F8388_007379 [Cannabis sativa]